MKRWASTMSHPAHTPGTIRRSNTVSRAVSLPIIQKDGTLLGALCAIDLEPAKVNNKKRQTMFLLFAEMIANHRDARIQLLKSEEDRRQEIEISNIREQFVAILGHDLRNTLASMAWTSHVDG